ncbi:hypothetical protein HPB48_027083 [Haemaphysalis longicornis]|uniref:Uncharacterized protein n=1 Tax=Haemaphysalis longicornis TaxID=44386 RepID=A0A9J6HCC9_HAELO|nr:hypothetical protein HPB48_027083 [Haemaphysalis longicornis]
MCRFSSEHADFTLDAGLTDVPYVLRRHRTTAECMPDTGGDRLCPMSRARPSGRAHLYAKVQTMRPRTSHGKQGVPQEASPATATSAYPRTPSQDHGNLPTTAPTTSCCLPSAASKPGSGQHSSPVPLVATSKLVFSHRTRMCCTTILPPIAFTENPCARQQPPHSTIIARKCATQETVLEAQAARREQLERRIEELLPHVQKITQAPTESTSQVTPASSVMQQPCVPPTPSDIERLEKLTRKIAQQMESCITAIEQRQEVNETVRRKNRRKQKTPGPSNPPS